MIRLVIAEDDKKIAEIQHRLVERVEGYEIVGIAHTVGDARDMLEILRPDLLMLDIHFPDGSGLDLLRELRAGKGATDVVLLTAAKEVEALTEALRCGVFDYIVKPLVFDRLRDTLENFKQHRDRLGSLRSVSQREVDRLLPRAAGQGDAPTPGRLPKGIDALTLSKVVQVFSERQDDAGLSAEEVGERIGVSRTTARRYLEHLVTENKLTADVAYGSVGRPERKYCAAP
jgi:two-component system CitB family response regulator